MSGSQKIRYLNGGLWSEKIQYSGVQYSDGYCTTINQNLSDLELTRLVEMR